MLVFIHIEHIATSRLVQQGEALPRDQKQDKEEGEGALQ